MTRTSAPVVRGLHLHLSGGIWAAMLLTVAILAYLSWTGYRDSVRQAATATEGVAQIDASALGTSISMADLILADMAQLAAPYMADPAGLAAMWNGEKSHIEMYLARVREVHSVNVVDAAGTILHSTRPEVGRLSLADRGYFQDLRRRPEQGLLISPVVDSRLTGMPVFVLARAVVDGRGRFLGAVVAPIDLALLRRLFEGVDLGDNWAATVRRADDSSIVVRYPKVAGMLNEQDPSHPAHQAILAGQLSGTVDHRSTVDGRERVTSFRKVEALPLYVVVGMDREYILADWRQRLVITVALAALAFSFILVIYRRLMATNGLLQNVLAASSEFGVIATDPGGRITVFNEGAQRILGHAPEALVGRESLLFFHDPAELAQRAAELTPILGRDARDFTVLSAGADRDGAEQREWTYRRADGRCIPVALTVTPMRAGSGKLAGYLGVVQDLTERRAAEAERRRHEEHLQRIVSTINEGMWSLDGDLKTDFVNQAMADMLGYAPAEMLGRPTADFVFPEDQADNVQRMTVRQGGRAERYERRWRRKDGSACWCYVSTAPILDRNGRFAGSMAMCTDITERKRLAAEIEAYGHDLEAVVAERTRQLTTSEANLRLILESTADGLYGLDAAGRVTFINPAACRMLGLDPESVIGHSIHHRIHHTHADGTPYAPRDCPTNLTLREGRVVTVADEVYWHGNGHPVPVIYSTHPMVRDGQVIGAVVSFMDVTERRALEEEREAARQSAERLARIKAEFLANMSHEIRTPLNGVLGLARIGFHDSEGRKTQETFARILDSGNLLLGVVNDILDFSKIEAGKLDIEAVPVSLAQVCREAVELMAERARAKGIALTADLAPSLPRACLTDPLRLKQILMNLLSNAVKFTTSGGVTLAARVAAGRLHLDVIDTGIGMEAGQLEQLFAPFQQADSSTTRRFGGTGLGLAITDRLVHLMAGTIAVVSKPGQGSTFSVTLPCLETDLAVAGVGTELPEQRPRLQGLSILAAEDNEINRIILEEILRREGAQVVLVHNGREAVDRVRHDGPTAFAVVLMDIQMPEMDGHEATRRIHALAPGLPVIGQTAHTMAEERARCLASGMVGHVAKPIDVDQLVNAVLAVAGSGAVGGPGTAPVTAAAPAPGRATRVDWPALESRFARKPDFVAKLVHLFVSNHGDLPQRLRRSLAEGDHNGLAALIHSLKGVAGNIMAGSVADQALQVERLMAQGATDLAAAVERLVAELETTVREIRSRYPV